MVLEPSVLEQLLEKFEVLVVSTERDRPPLPETTPIRAADKIRRPNDKMSMIKFLPLKKSGTEHGFSLSSISSCTMLLMVAVDQAIENDVLSRRSNKKSSLRTHLRTNKRRGRAKISSKNLY